MNELFLVLLESRVCHLMIHAMPFNDSVIKSVQLIQSVYSHVMPMASTFK